MNIFKRMIYPSLVLAIALLQCQFSFARSWRDGVAEELPWVFEFNEAGHRIGILEEAMAYRYYLPKDYDPANEYPLMLFMHGSGESGRDNERQVSAFLDGMINLTESRYPAILLVPQLPRSFGWSPYQSLDRTDEILEIMRTDFSVDDNRLYVTGLSMGGFGTMSYLHYYHADQPGTLRFAAAAPVAGAWINPNVADILQDTPIWLGHGSLDDVVSPDGSREAYNALAGNELDAPILFDKRGARGPMAESGNVRFTEYPGVGHGSWGNFYGSLDLYDWMFSQSLVPEPSSFVTALVGVMLAASRRRSSSRWH